MKIIIPGSPVSQARMKHARRGNFVVTYDPKAKEKEEIRGLLNLMKLEGDFDFPRISFIFYMPIPASIPKKMQALYNSETLKHDKKPDVDNLIKLYLDCLDGIAIQGDQKVSLGPCIKLYSPNPRTEVSIIETDKLVTPKELDYIFPASLLLAEQSSSEKVFPLGLCSLGPINPPQSADNLIP